MMLHFVGENTEVTAQDRIAHVLRLDMQNGMRVLHKGKILFPDTKQSSTEVSLQLLEICDKGGKPLVMGSRMTEKEQKRASMKWAFNLWISVLKACFAKAMALIRSITAPFLSLGRAKPGEGGFSGPEGEGKERDGEGREKEAIERPFRDQLSSGS